MATDYHHGVRVVEVNDGIRPIRTIATAVIGIVCTADDADATAFPLDTPVLVTNIMTAIGKAGVDGTLAKTLDAIADHGAPIVVVVRVAEGLDEAATNTNVIGTVTAGGQYTGMQALLAAEAKIGVRPRILACPGLDTQDVAVALATIAQKLRAFAYVAAWNCDTVSAAIAYRANFSQRELMLIWPDFLTFNVATSLTETAWATARAVGLRAKLDEDIGWHKTLSNIGVNGVAGISQDVSSTCRTPPPTPACSTPTKSPPSCAATDSASGAAAPAATTRSSPSRTTPAPRRSSPTPSPRRTCGRSTSPCTPAW